MAAYTYSMLESKPQGSDIANQLDTFIQNWRKGLNERYEVEHYGLDDAGTGQDDSSSADAQGRHRPGKVACVLIDTNSNIDALTGMVKGSIAYDTDANALLLHDGTDWDSYSISSTPGSGSDILTTRFTNAAGIVSSMNTNGSWGTSPVTPVNAFDGSDVTNWGSAIVSANGNALIYWDLTDQYRGWIEIVVDAYSVANATASVVPVWGYDSATSLSATQASRGLHNHFENNAIRSTAVSSVAKNNIIVPFHGRYAGVEFDAGSAQDATFIVYQINITGAAV